jgi:hypothetical protein
MRFTISDLLWATVVCALVACIIRAQMVTLEKAKVAGQKQAEAFSKSQAK